MDQFVGFCWVFYVGLIMCFEFVGDNSLEDGTLNPLLV